MSAQLDIAAVVFPSRDFFAALARLMNDNRARQEQLGYIDCVAGFTVTEGARARHFRVVFEEFSAVAVDEVTILDDADFTLVGELATWRTMLESIVAGGGRPALDQTLNRLSHMGTPMRLEAADPLRADLYFRYNQSLQEFFNATATLDLAFRAAVD